MRLDNKSDQLHSIMLSDGQDMEVVEVDESLPYDDETVIRSGKL